MRHLIAVSSTLCFFVVGFGALYILFRASAPHIRGLVGGGLFLLASLLLLYKDFAGLEVERRLPALPIMGHTPADWNRAQDDARAGQARQRSVPEREVAPTAYVPE
jgi:hypothetical protein